MDNGIVDNLAPYFKIIHYPLSIFFANYTD